MSLSLLQGSLGYKYLALSASHQDSKCGTFSKCWKKGGGMSSTGFLDGGDHKVYSLPPSPPFNILVLMEGQEDS